MNLACSLVAACALCSCMSITWRVTLGQAAVDMLLDHFVHHLNCVDGVSINGYTLGQCHRPFMLLVLTIAKTRFPSLCSCVWWVTTAPSVQHAGW